jgi:hypothetical protein
MLFDSFCCPSLLSLEVTTSVVWELVRITTTAGVGVVFQKLEIEFPNSTTVYSQNSFVS